MVSELHSKGPAPSESGSIQPRRGKAPHLASVLVKSLHFSGTCRGKGCGQDCRWQRHPARRHLLNFPATTLSTQCKTAHVRGKHPPPRPGRCCPGSSSKPSTSRAKTVNSRTLTTAHTQNTCTGARRNGHTMRCSQCPHHPLKLLLKLASV